MDKVKSYLLLPLTEKRTTDMGRDDGGSRRGWGVLASKGDKAATDELSGHKKTVSESETVAGQHSEKITEIPEAKSEKPLVAKTFRFPRGSLLSRFPRFVNKFFD